MSTPTSESGAAGASQAFLLPAAAAAVIGESQDAGKVIWAGLYFQTDTRFDAGYEIGHVECATDYGDAPGIRGSWHLEGIVALDSRRLCSGEQTLCIFCNKSMWPR